jgi:hypothetical protein
MIGGDLTKLEISFLIINQKNPFKLFNPNGVSGGDTKKPKFENRILILRSIACNIKYIQDIPSVLLLEKSRVTKKNGDLVFSNVDPQWSLVVNCTKQTILNYGPWYDRQREQLWKYFFPQTYESFEPVESDRRQISKFDFYLNLKDNTNSEINLIFCSNMSDIQDKKLTFKCRGESSFSCSIPWITKKDGFQTSICGTFNFVQGYTNMTFKHFLSAEQLKLNVDIHYPLIWNDLQTWDINIELCRATVFLVFQHKFFFQDLINDWSSKTIADLRNFVPYIYNINTNVTDLEVLLPSNQHNWIDTQFLENNAFLALLTPNATIKTSLSFEDYLPEKTTIKLEIKVSFFFFFFFISSKSIFFRQHLFVQDL